jgi:hypothetical protein
MKLFLIFFFNFICFNNSSFIPNINDLASKEFNNYQKILEIQKIPCYIQTIRIKTFNSAFQKKRKFKLKTINEVNDLIGFRFVFYNDYDLLKFYYHLYNEKKIVISHNEIIDNNISYSGILLRYQNEYSNCPIYQIECQMLILINFYKLIFNEDKNKIKKQNINFPYNL